MLLFLLPQLMTANRCAQNLSLADCRSLDYPYSLPLFHYDSSIGIIIVDKLAVIKGGFRLHVSFRCFKCHPQRCSLAREGEETVD